MDEQELKSSSEVGASIAERRHRYVNTAVAILALIVAIAALVPPWLELDVGKPWTEWGAYCGPDDPGCMIYVGIRNQDFKPLEGVEVKLVSNCGVSLPSGADKIEVKPPVQVEVEAVAQTLYVRTQAVLGRGDHVDIWFPVPQHEFVRHLITNEEELDKCFDVWVFSDAGLGKLVIVHVETPFLVGAVLPIIMGSATPTPMGILPNLPLP